MSTQTKKPQSLDELLDGIPRRARKGCALCGEKTSARIELAISKLEDNGHASGRAGTRRAVTVSLCEAHALSMWASLGSQIEKLKAERR